MKKIHMKKAHAKKGKLAWMTVFPAAALGASGLAMSVARKRSNSHADEANEKLTGVTNDVLTEIDDTVSELKSSIWGNSGPKLEKNIDKAVEEAKKRLDKLSSSAHTKLQSQK
jgi:hypothetical protein